MDFVLVLGEATVYSNLFPICSLSFWFGLKFAYVWVYCGFRCLTSY